jgi:hypothetical protein
MVIRDAFWLYVSLLSSHQWSSSQYASLLCNISDVFSQYASLLSHIRDAFYQYVSPLSHIRDAFYQYTSPLSHIRDAFYQYASPLSHIRDAFYQYASLLSHISYACLRVTNLFTSQTQHKWRVFFCVTNDPLDASLISIFWHSVHHTHAPTKASSINVCAGIATKLPVTHLGAWGPWQPAT